MPSYNYEFNVTSFVTSSNLHYRATDFEIMLALREWILRQDDDIYCSMNAEELFIKHEKEIKQKLVEVA